MYEIDGICYAGNPADEVRVARVKPLTGRMLLVDFESGERRLFDTTRLTGSAFAPLTDAAVFDKVEVFHGFPTWADGEIDVSPEFVYENSVPYDESDIIGGAELHLDRGIPPVSQRHYRVGLEA